ncbi:MAG: glycoside hydrolase [Chthonomonadales bacterium]
MKRIAFMLAVAGVCAAVSSSAATVKHSGPLWTLQNRRLNVRVEAQSGSITVEDKAASFVWRQAPWSSTAPSPRFRTVEPVRNGIRFDADFGNSPKSPLPFVVTVTLPNDGADLRISVDTADRRRPVQPFSFLPPFLLDTPGAVIAMADYSDGHLYPAHFDPFPAEWLAADRLDMPWVGVCDLQRGMGYALIIETSDDAVVTCRRYPSQETAVAAPMVQWLPSKGSFAYPRSVLYRFVSHGGYVALAKAYRGYAAQQGLVVPFRQKLKKNPNIARLFGAPDVWGNASLAFARQAKEAGVDKMLIQGRTTPKDMAAIRDLGYLPSEYDNYTDILPVAPGKEIDANHDILPDHAVMLANGRRMTAWLTWDKKTQFMKRCPAFWVPTARIVIPKVLEQYPFLGRFIDVTTAEGLYECYDPNHPLTKTQKRRCGEELLSYVRSLHLVTGGEHGIWWSVPYLDYIEGMMSGGARYYSWPAGHLIHPKSKDEQFVEPWGNRTASFNDYLKWGIGHQWRAPLWELVFHDCIVSTWYWGDASDFLLDAAPEITPKKDAFNILYGTIPLLWADSGGSWTKNRTAFLRTYRNTCKLHEVLAGTEMLSHEFLTQDHDVQRTRFSNGVTVVVNFGEHPYSIAVKGHTHLLPQNGWVVWGPGVWQSRTLIDGRVVTRIAIGRYRFTETE